MTPEISVIMPAFRAQGTIVEAAASALTGQGVAVELVICSDDGMDYRALLRAAGISVQNVTHCHTNAPQSGPSTARNIALKAAKAPIIAALDADDAYTPERLRKILTAMMRESVGVGTGPTIEQTRDRTHKRIATSENARLSLEKICGLRMPYSPVFQRTLAPNGWPPVSFAEDMLLNAHLCCEAGGYAFADQAYYHYFIEQHSLVQGVGSLDRAITGYHEILDGLPANHINQGAWPEITLAISADLHAAKFSKATGWRETFRI